MPAKLLLLVTQSDDGGAQRYVNDLAVGLTDRRYKVTVACGPGGPLIARLRRNKVDVRVIADLARPIRPWKDGRAFWEIYSLIHDGPYDLVHSNSSKAGFLARVAGRAAAGKRHLFTAHGFVFQEERSQAARSAFLLLEKAAGMLTDRLITVCDADRELALQHRIVPCERVITIHNGILPSPPLPTAESRKRLALPARIPVVGTVANMYPNKGLMDFVAAARHVIQRHPKTFFAVIGHGPQYLEVVEAIRQAGLNDRFRLYGQIEEAWKLVSAFDVFVLSSRKEGMPYSILEAMNAGVPVVATRVGGIPEAIEDNVEGLLTPSGAPDEMAHQVDRLLRDRALGRTLASRARRKLVHYFNIDRMIDETERVYESLL
ncbi:MAG: glycosyltransferase family 4 protein [Nitrospirae bacterium]|nr:glycosyltransferase family 4 protein [Nitrospirota bacterium]